MVTYLAITIKVSAVQVQRSDLQGSQESLRHNRFVQDVPKQECEKGGEKLAFAVNDVRITTASVVVRSDVFDAAETSFAVGLLDVDPFVPRSVSKIQLIDVIA